MDTTAAVVDAVAIQMWDPSRTVILAERIVPFTLRFPCGEPAPLFRRGDCNDDGTVDVSDSVCMLLWLFNGDANPPCVKAADADDSGAVDLTDTVYVLNFLFSGGLEPAAPFAGCGEDPTQDDLPCQTSQLCE